jgi:hypothetical protein
MIGSLQLQYNRGRQAVITTELIDIITVRLLLDLVDYANHTGCLGFVSGSRCRRDITRKGMQYLALRVPCGASARLVQHSWWIESVPVRVERAKTECHGCIGEGQLLTIRLLTFDPRPSYSAASSSASTRSCNSRQTSKCAVHQPHSTSQDRSNSHSDDAKVHTTPVAPHNAVQT